MGRYFGMRPAEVRDLLMTDFFMLDGFLLRHPPVDLLVAAYLGVKPQGRAERRADPTVMAKLNAEALEAMPARRRIKMIDQMPAFLRTPEKLQRIEEMRAAHGK